MNKIFIIEHLEPRVFEWCRIEYENISKTVGKNSLWFTNVKSPSDKIMLEKFGKVFGWQVRKLNLDRVCVLDPDAKRKLSPRECKKINYFVFGGILGDYPPKKRTKKELTPFIKNTVVRNIGKKQMSTDNAVYVVKEISEGKKLEEMKFIEGAEIELNDIESVRLPYRYRIVDGKPFMSPEILNYLKRKKSF